MGKILSAFKGRKGHWVVKYPYELPSFLIPLFHKIYEIGMKDDFKEGNMYNIVLLEVKKDLLQSGKFF